MSQTPHPDVSFRDERRSACMDAAHARERERVAAMTPLQRAKRALELGVFCRRLAEMHQRPRK
ncbi:MAG: hypothetical protein AB2A00_03590 [Myxococcota bacterium]